MRSIHGRRYHNWLHLAERVFKRGAPFPWPGLRAKKAKEAPDGSPIIMRLGPPEVR